MYSFSGAAPTGMRVIPGCLFNTLSTQGLLLAWVLSMLEIHGWTILCGKGFLRDLEEHIFTFCEKVQTLKVYQVG